MVSERSFGALGEYLFKFKLVLITSSYVVPQDATISLIKILPQAHSVP